jgi:hypothetical protein
MEKRDNLSLVLHGIQDLRLEQTPLPLEPGPNGKHNCLDFKY